MTTIDNRVVSITFDNAAFEKRVATTMTSLSTLNSTINNMNTTGRAVDLGKSMNLEGIGSAVDNISQKFSALGVIGFTVIQKLTTEAMEFIGRVGNTVLGPVLAGGRRRAENIEQALFQFRGLGLDAAGAMESARLAVTGTAFGLDVAAKAAAQFGASGIEVGDDMTGALRGIAGVAAMTNTSFEEMSDVFTSAAGVGKISGNTLNRIAVRGMNAAAALAKEWGLSEAEVRRMASEGEISFQMFAEGMDAAFGEHATKANETYAGSLANVNAALARVGAKFYGDTDDRAGFLTQMRDVFNSLSPVIDEVGKALEPVIELMLEVTKAGTEGIIKFLNGVNLSPLTLGITSIVGGLKSLYESAKIVGRVIKNAFTEVFPINTGRTFLTITNAFKEFAEALKPTGPALLAIRKIFLGVFSVFSIGWTILKEIVKTFFSLFGSLNNFAGSGILSFFTYLGTKLHDLQQVLVVNGAIERFFESFRNAISSTLGFVKLFYQAVKDAMNGVGGAFDKVKERWSSLGGLFGGVNFDFGKLLGPFRKLGEAIGDIFSKIWTEIKNWFGTLGSKMSAEAGAGDYQAVLDTISVGLLGGLTFIFSRFLKNGLGLNLVGDGLFGKNGIFGDLSKTIFGKDSLKSINGVFDGLTGHLKALTAEVKSQALLKIAGAVAVLAVAVLILSTIDPEDLAKALAAMTYGFGNLVGVLTLITKLQIGPLGAGGMVVIATGLILVATAITILSVAVLMLSALSLSELAKGLGGVVVAIGLMTGAAQTLTSLKGGIFITSVSLIALAVAINMLAIAVKIFATMDWGELAVGFAGLASSLILIAEVMKIMPEEGMMKTAAALVVLGGALIIIGVAMRIFASMDFKQLAQGLAGMASSLILIASSMKLFPPQMMATAAALLAVAGSMVVLGVAMRIFASMNFEELARGLGGMASALLLLVSVMPLMTGGLAGAKALAAMALSMLLLSIVMKEFSKLSFGEIATGFLAMAGTIAVLAVSAILLAKITPAILALGIALGAVGLAFALFGVGAYLIGKGLEALAKSGGAAIETVLGYLDLMLTQLPKVATAVAKSMIDFVNEFLAGLPIILDNLAILVGSIIDTLIDLTPRFMQLLNTLISSALQLITDRTPELVAAGYAVILALLQGLRDNIDEITTTVTEIIDEFLTAFTEELPDLMDSIKDLFTTYLTALAEDLGELMATLAPDIGISFVNGFINGLDEMFPGVREWFDNFVDGVIKWVKSGFGIFSPSRVMRSIGVDVILGFIQGLAATIGQVASWFLSLPGKVIRWIGNAFIMLYNVGKNIIQGLWNGFTSRFRGVGAWLSRLPGDIRSKIGNAFMILYNVGKNIIMGLWNGINAMRGWFANKMKEVATSWIPGPVKRFLNMESPSRVFMGFGKNIAEGLIIGMDNMRRPIEASSRSMADVTSKNYLPDRAVMADNLKTALSKAIDDASRLVDNVHGLNPTITPVLDLSDIQKNAKRIGGLINAEALPISGAYGQASEIASTRIEADPSATQDVGRGDVTFEQNIYAPEQLSTADIYRQTSNQVRSAKEELKIP